MKQMCTCSFLAIESRVWFSQRGAEGVSLQLEVEDVVVLYSMCDYIFISILRVMFISHKLKLNGHQHEVSAMVLACSAFFSMLFSFRTIS